MKRLNMRTKWGFSGLVAAVAVASMAGGPALAALGENVASVEKDRVQLEARAAQRSGEGYSVQEMTLPTGTVVREYLSPAGQVFAVSWRGPVIPNLRLMLGAYFERLQKAEAAPHPGGHRHLVIREPDLVLHSSGHMRAFSGSAYLPGLVPSNVSLSELK